MAALDKLDAKLRSPSPHPHRHAPAAPNETIQFALLADGTVEGFADFDERGIAWTRATGATMREAAEALAAAMGSR